ncbi:MAG: permease [Candidatus Magasanikbacteria bacterium]
MFVPLELLANWLTYNIFHLTPGTHTADALNFFIFDTLKIFVLLILITHLMAVIRYFLPIQKFKTFLISRKWYGADYLLASTFGAVTPFCSCSSIPLFIGFLQAGIPLGVVFAFLITSPLINEIAVTLFIGAFGWKLTLAYVVAGMAIGVIGGFVIGKLKMEKYVRELGEEEEKKCCGCCKNKAPLTKWDIAKKISKSAWSIVRSVALYIILGVAVGAAIHGFVPAQFFQTYLITAGWLAVPIAVIIAVPLYANASGVIPIIQALVAKGVPIGTAMAFMMATVGLSLPEAMMLKRVLKTKLLLTFFGIVTVGIMIIGFLFNGIF